MWFSVCKSAALPLNLLIQQSSLSPFSDSVAVERETQLWPILNPPPPRARLSGQQRANYPGCSWTLNKPSISF
jgi:hypothetical protein